MGEALGHRFPRYAEGVLTTGEADPSVHLRRYVFDALELDIRTLRFRLWSWNRWRLDELRINVAVDEGTHSVFTHVADYLGS